MVIHGSYKVVILVIQILVLFLLHTSCFAYGEDNSTNDNAFLTEYNFIESSQKTELEVEVNNSGVLKTHLVSSIDVSNDGQLAVLLENCDVLVFNKKLEVKNYFTLQSMGGDYIKWLNDELLICDLKSEEAMLFDLKGDIKGFYRQEDDAIWDFF